MTEQKKMVIPSLYSETEPVKKAGGNDFYPIDPERDYGIYARDGYDPDDEWLYDMPHKPYGSDYPRYYDSNMFEEYAQYVRDQNRALSPEQQAKFKNIDATIDSMDQIAQEAKRKGSPYASSYKKEVEDAIGRRNEVSDDMEDYNEHLKDYEDSLAADKVMARKKRRGTAPITRSIDFEHECDVWGNNLAENRLLYEHVRKAGGADLNSHEWNGFGNLGRFELYDPEDEYPYANTAWLDMLYGGSLDPWKGKGFAENKDESEASKYYIAKVQPRVKKGYDILGMIRREYGDSIADQVWDLFDDYDINAMNKARDKYLKEDTGRAEKKAKDLLDRKERRGKTFQPEEQQQSEPESFQRTTRTFESE